MEFLPRRHSSAPSAQQVIDQLQRDLDVIEQRVRMIHSYERITPYVVETEQQGTAFRFIVYHKESEAWFGNATVDHAIHRSRHLLQSDDVVFDLGCNSGYHTAWLALNASRGHVYAFDPFPWNAAATRAQAVLNGCRNVTVYDCGVGDADRTLQVVPYSSRTFNADTHDATLAISVRNIESFRHHKPRFLKIDIEGAEADLARTGLMRWPSVRAGYVEMHPEFITAGNRNPADFLNLASDSGFSLSDGTSLVQAPVAQVVATAYYFERPRRPLLEKLAVNMKSPRTGTDFFAALPAKLGDASDQVRADVLAHVDYLAAKAELTRDALLAGRPFRVAPQVLADARANITAVLAQAAAVRQREIDGVEDLIALAEATLQGWCTREKAMAIAELVTNERPQVCVEIGVYGGRSLVPAAAALRANGEGVIYGIETWRPDVATEHATSAENDEWWRRLDFHAIKTDFLKFVALNGLASQVRLVEAPSADAASLFGTIDYLHIDGAHSTYNAAEDVVLYAKKVKAGGIIILDDANWATTAPALAILDSLAERVRTFLDEHDKPACIVFRKR